MRLYARVAAFAVAAILVWLPSSALASGQRSGSGQPGSGAAMAEARSGWDQVPPSDAASPTRDRLCEQDRLRDGSCDAGSTDCAQSRTRSKVGSASAASAAAGKRGASPADASQNRAGAVSVAQVRSRISVQTLARIEARLRQLDGYEEPADGVLSVALRLAERLQEWLGEL
ncbi:MAG: hypothetical protein N3B11_00840 [Coriobacteriia bacterium]|nr:hypothetical protein [Coriobacteriia bacterium]